MPLDWRLFFLGLWVSLFRGPSEAGVAAAIGFAMFNIGIPSGLIGILGLVKKIYRAYAFYLSYYELIEALFVELALRY